jgi:hypothetical protein
VSDDPADVPHTHDHRHGEDADFVRHEHEHDHGRVTARTWRHHENTVHRHPHSAGTNDDQRP